MNIARYILRTLAWLTCLGAVLALAAWMFGRIVTDRWTFSQWIFWTPTPAVLLGVLGLLVSSHLCEIRAPRTQTITHDPGAITSRPRLRRVRPCVWVALVLVVLWLFFFDWHVHRKLIPSRKPGNAEKVLTIAYWNMATNRDDIPIDFLATLDEDIVVVANSHSRVNWNSILSNTNQHWTLTRVWPFTILSRVPVETWSLTQLHLRGRLPKTPHDFIGPRSDQTSFDVGLAAYFEFGLPGPDHNTFTIWILDLPSDTSLHKRDIAHQTRSQIDTFNGLVRSSTTPRKPLETPGFPEADIILGDFNIPRSSGSLRTLIDPNVYVGAYESAGVGPCATFPRAWSLPFLQSMSIDVGIPLVHIDQIFVNKAHRVLRYRVVDPGTARHYAQRVAIERSVDR